MDLPFVRQYPNGRRALATISVADDVGHLGKKFIALGGAYVCEILPSGYARIAACLEGKDGKQQDVEQDACENGPGLPEAVERLVRASVQHIETHG
jgi:hypothetical protein